MLRSLLIGTGLLAGSLAPALAQTAPRPQPAGSGLQAEYYNGTEFQQLVTRRRDAAIDFDWKKQPPVEGLGPEYFSVRWQGYLLAPVTGEYEFSTVMDDGLRVWVGGKRIIDAWKEQDHVPATVRLHLEAGHYYRLRVDYFQTILDSRAVLRWRLPNTNQLVTVSGRQMFTALPATAKPVPPKPQPAKPQPPTNPAVARTQAAPPGVRVAPVQSAVVVGPRPQNTPPTPAPRRTAPVAVRSSVVPPRRQPATRTVTPSTRPVRVPVVVGLGDTLPDLTRLRRGDVLALRHLYFVQSQARLLPSSEPVLARLVRLLRQQAALRFEVAGHTDNVGDVDKNLRLSEQRAQLVRRYLVRHGIDSTRLTAVGYGGARPIADNRDPQQRPRNRRVELVMR